MKKAIIFIIFMFVLSSFAFSDITTELKGHYLADETSGNLIDDLGIYNLTQAGSVGSVTGIKNGARGIFSDANRFTGNTFPHTDTSNLTFNVLVNASNFDNGYGNVYTTGDNNNQNRITLSTNATGHARIDVSKYGVTDGCNPRMKTAMTTNQWYMVTTTFRGDTRNISIYLNGTFEVSCINTGYTSNATTWIRVGTDVWAIYDNAFHGAIDEFSIYNRTLSASDVLELYEYIFRH